MTRFDLGTLARNLFALLRGNVKCLGMKIFNRRSFYYNVFVRMFRGVEFVVRNRASVHIGNNFRVGKNAWISCNGGCLKIGSNVGIGRENVIGCYHSVTIGAGTTFGPNVHIYDNDHLFNAENGVDQTHYKTAPVVIGKNVWIGANTVILRGTTIGDNCVVGAGSVIKGEFPSNSLIVQKRETAVKSIK